MMCEGRGEVRTDNYWDFNGRFRDGGLFVWVVEGIGDSSRFIGE